MSDRQVVLAVAAVWLGAAVPTSVPAAVVGVLVFIGVWVRRPFVVACAGCALASMLAGSARNSADVPAGTFVGEVTVASDPEPIPRGIRLDVEARGVRLEAVAFGGTAGDLRARLLGERLNLTGAVTPLGAPSRWAELRGIQGRLAVDEVHSSAPGRLHHRIANGIRRTIAEGARVMPRNQQVLLVGLVYGDDRHHSALQRDDFAAAGLTHLLAVSGQNVAFTLILLGPLLRRFDYRGRFLLTLVVLFLFATLTRFEPSVLRASAMAAVAALAVVTARPASSMRVLALAVGVVVLLDTRIVESLAFQLSVAASLGILLLSSLIQDLVPGPRLVADAVAVTAGAQLAVSPLLLWRFDSLPVASLPANVLAGPAAGPVMMWGLTGGLLAGLIPFLAATLHLPTRVGVGWIEWVASASADAPLGSLYTPHLLVLGVALAVLVVGRRRPLRHLAAVAICAALVAPMLTLALTAPTTIRLGDETVVWRDDNHTIIETGGAPLEDVLEKLRTARVTQVDLVIVPRGNLADWERLQALRERIEMDEVWAPKDSTIPNVLVPRDGTTLRIEGVTLTTAIEGGTLRLAPATLPTSE